MATPSSPEAGSSAGGAAAPVNHLGRIFGALFNPKATFAEIAARPSWVAPILLLTLIGLGVSTVLNQKMDWESYIRQKAEQNTRFAQLSEPQKQRALESQVKFAPVSAYVFGAIGAVIFALILSGIYLGAFNLFAGAGLRFGAVFGITSHALIPTCLGSVLAIVVAMAKPKGELDPEHLLASNLGAVLGSDAPKWLVSLATSIEFFWIWVMVLLAVGFSAANPKKVSMGTAFGIVLGLWAAWLTVKVGWVAIFS